MSNITVIALLKVIKLENTQKNVTSQIRWLIFFFNNFV